MSGLFEAHAIVAAYQAPSCRRHMTSLSGDFVGVKEALLARHPFELRRESGRSSVELEQVRLCQLHHWISEDTACR